jgi:TRAP-type C4-dicarboxylate transport system permease small subunit
MPRGGRLVLEKLIYLLCIAICLYLGWFCLDLGIRAISTGDFDSRSFDLPRWLIYLPMVIGFFVAAVEFVRYLIGPASMYEQPEQEASL